jgi:polyisoprenoid-binding protein YceI
MAKHDEKTAEALIFTFKDGLLSKVAHDLKLRVTRFSVDVDISAPSVVAELDPRSLVVLATVHDGKEDPAGLSDADKQKIASQIQKDVLEVEQHGRIRFTSRSVQRRADGGYSITGDLELHGTTRSISFDTRLTGDKQLAEVELHQPDYGIVPFKAMLGTLKVKPDVKVRISVPNT